MLGRMKPIAGACLALALLVCGASPRAATSPAGASPSPADRAAVLAVVQKFFDAMAAGDAEALRGATVPTFQFHAVRHDAKGTVSRRTLDEFVARFGASKEAVLERMWDPTVLIQDRIATVWTPYDFHRDGKFTHSGIDVFTLARTDTGWKILDLAFTIEPNVPSQHPAGPPPAARK